MVGRKLKKVLLIGIPFIILLAGLIGKNQVQEEVPEKEEVVRAEIERIEVV